MRIKIRTGCWRVFGSNKLLKHMPDGSVRRGVIPIHRRSSLVRKAQHGIQHGISPVSFFTLPLPASTHAFRFLGEDQWSGSREGSRWL
jgi:hypothetical protein